MFMGFYIYFTHISLSFWYYFWFIENINFYLETTKFDFFLFVPELNKFAKDEKIWLQKGTQ